MGIISDLARDALRYFVIDGVPDSGKRKPKKDELIAVFDKVDAVVDGVTAGSLATGTVAQLNAITAADVGQMAWVVADPVPAHNGIYSNTGTAMAAVWTRRGDLPNNVIGLIDAGAGSANSIVATSGSPLPTTSSRALLTMSVFEANTGAVTMAVNGASAKPLVAMDGSALIGGELSAGMALLMVDAGSQFRILTDLRSAANLALAQTARDEAEDFATATGVDRAQVAADAATVAAARLAAVAASEASGPAVFYDTKAAATAAVAGLPANQVVEVFVDESHNGKRTRYRKEGGVLAFKLKLDPLYDKSVTLAKVAEETQIALASPDPLKKLDLFQGFDGNPGGADWEANTFADYIAGIDALFAAELLAGDMVKTDRGACSDGVQHIVSYKAGSGFWRVLLIAGAHGVERLGGYAAMRFFQAFVQSSHPSMVLLRSQITVTLVPVASPWAWDEYERVNFNGVDQNRNYPFYWTRFTSADPLRYKGTAAFSEPETSVIKTIVDEGQDCLISCHNMGAGERPYTMVIKPPSNWVTGKRNLCLSAAEIWKRKNPGATFENMADNPNAENPDEVSWFNLYNTWTLGNFNTGCVLFESNSDLGGSGYLEMTDDAAHLYCGHIDTFIRHWLASGQAAPEPVAASYSAMRRSPATTTAMSAGGTQLDTTSAQNLTFDFFGPGGSVSQGYFDLIYPEPGSYVIMADGYFEGGATDTDVTAGIETASAPNLSTWGIDNDSLCSFLVHNASRRADFKCFSRKTLSALGEDNRLRVRMRFTAVSASGPKLLRCRVFALFTPNHTLVPAPVINGL